MNGWILAVVISTASIFSSCLIASDEPVEHRVVIESFVFSPTTLEVKLGDSIVWVNQDIVPHTATGNDQQWDTEHLEFGAHRKILVTEEVIGGYFCRYHPAMTGNIVLQKD